MMRFSPTLILTRLRIEKDGEAAYDERFHQGVNIIRGDNSSGKSTILNFIFYALGGDLSDWSEDAILCTRVLAEVSLNGSTATLSREVVASSGQPMEIFGGDLDASLAATRSDWLRFPYSRSSKESFSQTLFRLLSIPEAAGEATGNLTMNQVLRLLYADQLSPVENLFKYDGRWDSPNIRDAVGRLLCGAQETQIYENELKLRALQKEHDALEGELKAIFTAFGRAGESLTPEWVELQRSKLSRELAALIQQIGKVERRQIAGSEEISTRKAQEDAYSKVQDALKVVADVTSRRDALSFECADLGKYVAGLKMKIDALRESKSVADVLGDVRFETCPACFELVIDAGEHACHLCKTPIDPEKTKDRLVSLINEAVLQVKQVEELLAKRILELEGAETTLGLAKLNWQQLAVKLSEIQSRPTTQSQDELRKLHSHRGYLERQIEEQGRLSTVIDRISRISSRKSQISSDVSKLNTQNDGLRSSQEERLSIARTAIAEEVKSLLRSDLRRQDSFVNPNIVSFDFGSNRISVDHHTYFSASSRVILKTSFFVGFLLAALKHSFFRHPRFCLIDTIEDKGMEQERSHNFQRQIVKRSVESVVEHQIIFATAMIAPELDSGDFTVGKSSTLDRPTLNIGVPSGSRSLSS
jgi:outer membrane murein-binding lipoprotein Lpp